MLIRFALLVSLLFAALTAYASPGEKAAAVFEQYQALWYSFDPSVTDLYASNAQITNRRTYPTGQVREIEIPIEQFISLIKAAMPLAESRGDRSTFSEVAYAVEGENVRVTATRYSELKQYSSPFVLIIGPDASGEWKVLEEHSESRP